jgi:phage major head subunit gpT-like protein
MLESGLTQESLEFAIAELAKSIKDMEARMAAQPTHLIVPPSMFKLARRIVFPHKILKRRKGLRGRAMTLKWRRK